MNLFRPGGAGKSKPWAFMERFEIPNLDDPTETYLTRYRIVQTPWFAIYVHRMDGPDSRPTLHDHPWDFVSVIVRGGYVEATKYADFAAGGETRGDVSPHQPDHAETWMLRGFNVLTWGRVNRKRGEDTHTITQVFSPSTWTLMLVGRRRRVWGYLDPDGTWTRFDEHPHNAEFEAAMAARGRTDA